MTWRVGNHYNIHVYDGDKPVATFLRPEDAARAVAAVNDPASDEGLRALLDERDGDVAYQGWVTTADVRAVLAASPAPGGDTEWVMVGETLEPLRHPGAGWTPHAPRAVTPPPREYGLRAIFDAATRERAIAVLMGRRGVEDHDQGAYDAAWSDWDALVVAGLTAVRDGEAGDRD